MLLTDKKPLNAHFSFQGFNCLIDMSFDNILTVLEVLNDQDLLNSEKAQLILYLLTGDEVFEADDFLLNDDNVEFAEGFIREFFKTFMESEQMEQAVPKDIMGNPLPREEKEKSFDFSYDAGYIYASFMQAYQMDLYEQHGKLHWEVFLALFNSLPADTMIMHVIDIRTRDIPTGKRDEEQARALREAKSKYALPEYLLESGGE